MLKLIIYIVLARRNFSTFAYSNKLFTITNLNNIINDGIMCFKVNNGQPPYEQDSNVQEPVEVTSSWLMNFMFENKQTEEDPFETNHDVVYKFLFGENFKVKKVNKNHNQTEPESHNLTHYPTGRALRNAELFNHKSGVHLAMAEMMHRGQCALNVTTDYMQTAVDAFAIFVAGDLADIQRLPADYVLNSARTISMLKISHERLAATWNLVKGTKDPIQVTYETLEKFRPLFKYLNGKDMVGLNLTDHRILNYVGTHPDLDRHQVGLVASKYIKINSQWSEPKYLNLMNNLLCGVPITFMREIPENTYLQLSHQVFYHTRACDPLQRRFYLGMMTKTQALGKSYSWNAQDVSRLGLLLAEVEGPDLGAIKPEALAGLTAQVMMAMRPENLQHLTDVQLRYIHDKPYNILTQKLKMYKDQSISAGRNYKPVICIVLLNIIMAFTREY